MRFTDIGFDKDGIISFHIDEDKQFFYNPFLVALQAMIGDHILDDYVVQTGSLIPKYIPIRYLTDSEIKETQEKAIKWLIENCDKQSQAYYWRYNYSVTFGNEELTPGWVSAYAQAYVALAFLMLFRVTKRDMYKDYCLGALSGLVEPVENGGCMNVLSDDMVWFEEIPSKNATHIFNAHIMALIALAEAKEEFMSDMFDSYFICGRKALCEFRDYMNTGTMSSYDVPNSFSLQLLLDMRSDFGAAISIGRICLDDGVVNHTIDLSDKKCFDEGEAFASGVDWSAEVTNQGRRKVIIGACVRDKKIPGGDIQNTFVSFSNISTNSNCCKLSLEYETNKDIEIVIKKNSPSGFVEVGRNKRIILTPEKNSADILFRTSEIFGDTSMVYHQYHIGILTELKRFISQNWMERIIEDFRRNSEFQRRNAQLLTLSNYAPAVEALSVGVNTECGLRCKMCDIGSGNAEASIARFLKGDTRNQLDADLLIKRVEEAGEKLRVVHFVGTEPTLYSKLGYAVRELKKLGKEVLVTTNGINLKNTLDDMLSSGVDCIQISIDGPAKVHDYIRGKEGLFEEVTSLVRNHKDQISLLKKNGFRMVASCAISPINYMSLEELVDPLAESGFTDLWCTHMNYVTKEVADCHNMMNPGFHIGCSTIHPEVDPRKVNPWNMYCSIKKTRIRAQERGIGFVEAPAVKDYFGYEDLYYRPMTSVGAPVCSAPFRTLQVNADGNLCVMSRCFYLEVGNIKEISLTDAMMGGALSDLRNRLLSEEQWPACKRCCAVM